MGNRPSGQPDIVRRLMAATITNTEFLKGLRSIWREDLVGPSWGWIGRKCFKFLDDHGKAPGRNIEAVWAADHKIDPETKEFLEDLLSGLSDEWEREDDGFDPEYFLEKAREYFILELAGIESARLEAAADAGDIAKIEECVEKLKEGIEKSKRSACGSSKGITARELQEMDIPEPEWLVRGIFPAGLTLLAGKPKSGKSYLMINLAANLAAGAKVFNMIESEPTKVLYLGLEDPPWRIKKRLAEVLGEDQEWPENLTFFSSGEWPKLNEGGMEKFERYMREQPGTRLIIIDTLHKVRPKGTSKGNNVYSEDYRALERLQEFTAKHNIGIIIVHHTKKSKEKDVFDEISGSTGLTGATDTNMVFCKVPGPNQNIRMLYCQGRETGERELELSFEKHRIYLDDLPEPMDEPVKRISPQRKIILDTLEDQFWYPYEMATKDLIEAVGDSVGKGINTTLSQMVQSGQIIQTRRGFYMHPDKLDSLRANQNMREAARRRNSAIGEPLH